MKRLTWALLALVVAFLGASFADRCLDGPGCEDGGDCPPGCHVACADGCAAAPVEPAPPALAPPDRSGDRQAEAVFPSLERVVPPDPFPPRV